jgi:hypothetical protein
MLALRKLLASPMVIVAAIATSTFISNIASAQVVLTDNSSISESTTPENQAVLTEKSPISEVESTTPENQVVLTENYPISESESTTSIDSVEPLLNSSPLMIPAPDQDQISADEGMAQINSVSQFSDVQPTDWSFQALQNLVERYGCIAGYPNGTFRGNRAMTRYEFAAGLNACLERINERIAIATDELVSKEDVVTLQRLREEFASELASLRGRVDTLEARTSEIEANQFSTTTKLLGDLRVQTNAYFSGDKHYSSLQYLAFLGLLTSFSGRDLLITGLASTNTTFPDIVTTNNGRDVGPTREGASEASSAGDLFGNLRIITLGYQFPIGDKLNVDVIAINRYRFNPVFLNQFAPYYVRGNGPVGSFSIAPPMYLIGAGSGVSLNYKLSNSTVLKTSYLATFGNDSNLGGMFNGDYVAAAELNYNPNPGLFLQVAYQHGYFSSLGNFGFNNSQGFRGNGFVGSALANRFDDAGVLFPDASAVTTNGYLIGGYLALSPKIAIGGWANLIKARLIEKGDADIWSYSFQLAFPNLFKPGNHGGLVIGMEPTLTGLESDLPYEKFKNDTSLHLEAYYVHRITDRIYVTPSITWITAPNQDANNHDIVIGGIRTTFSF